MLVFLKVVGLLVLAAVYQAITERFPKSWKFLFPVALFLMGFIMFDGYQADWSSGGGGYDPSDSYRADRR